MKRQFRLRNGAIVEERRQEGTCESFGYIDDYTILDYGNISGTKKEEFNGINDYICLLLQKHGPPLGDLHGQGFDIIEELSLEEPS